MLWQVSPPSSRQSAVPRPLGANVWSGALISQLYSILICLSVCRLRPCLPSASAAPRAGRARAARGGRARAPPSVAIRLPS